MRWPQVAIAGHSVIITDNGIATGATTIAALKMARAAGAREVIVAVPVGVPDRIDAIRPLCVRVCFPPPKSELELAIDQVKKRSGSPAAAQQTIDLQKTTRVTQSAASILATWPGELIFHQDIHLAGGVASNLSAGKGTLHFKRQSELRADALQHLIHHAGKIMLYGSYEIQRHHVEILTRKASGTICLDPVCAMLLPPDQQAQLATNPRIQFRFKSGFDGG
jgi:hypothetical protein